MIAAAALGVTIAIAQPAPIVARACTANNTTTRVSVGQCAPNVTLADLGGRLVSLSSFRGYPVLLHFWAVACTTCAGEYPDFAHAVAVYRAKGLKVLAVDAWNEPASMIQGWQQSHHLPATLLIDPGALVSAQYSGTSTPTTYVVDRQGRITFSHTGPLGYDDFAQAIKRAL